MAKWREAELVAALDQVRQQLAEATKKAEADLVEWRRQDTVLQQIAALVDDEHISGPEDVLREVKATFDHIGQQLAEANERAEAAETKAAEAEAGRAATMKELELAAKECETVFQQHEALTTALAALIDEMRTDRPYGQSISYDTQRWMNRLATLLRETGTE